MRKEALVSSQIEGTQSSFSDLLLFELDEVPGVPMDDVREVSNYVAALEHGLERMRGGFPLSLRLLREMHGILLAKERGSAKDPGEFRHPQVWLGGPDPSAARFVPPPPERLMDCRDAASDSSTVSPNACRVWSERRSHTCSSRPSIRFSTATVASADC